MIPSVRLTVVNGRLAGTEYRIAGRRLCVVGRGEECGLRLPSEGEFGTVSRYHCILDIDPPDVRVGDFGSRNGTYINGVRIARHLPWHVPDGVRAPLGDHELHDGDELSLGSVTFRLAVAEASGAASACVGVKTADLCGMYL